MDSLKYYQAFASFGTVLYLERILVLSTFLQDKICTKSIREERDLQAEHVASSKAAHYNFVSWENLRPSLHFCWNQHSASSVANTSAEMRFSYTFEWGAVVHVATIICQATETREHQRGKKDTQKTLELLHLTIISYADEAKTPHKGNTQVTHPREQADKWLFQKAALLNITCMFNFKVKRKWTFSKTVIEKLLPGNVYSDIVADYFHKKEKTLSICQLKCVLWKYKFNFNASSYSMVMALMIPLLIHKSVNYLPKNTVAQAVWDSKSVTVYWRNSLTFITSQLTNQAGLRTNKSFLQSATPHFFVQMLPSIITHLRKEAFSSCWPDKVATFLTQSSLKIKRRMQRIKVTFSN